MSTTVVAEQAAPITKPAEFTNNVMVEKYLALRDKKSELDKEHKAKVAKFDLAMATLEGWLLDSLNTAGEESARTKAGTFYKTTATSVTVGEWDATLKFIRDNEAWDLLERRVSKTGIDAVLKDLASQADARRAAGETVSPGDLVVPGVNITRETRLNVRRS